MKDLKYFIIVILLIITTLISWRFYLYDYNFKDTINIKNFPKTIENWTSQDLPIEPADQAILETKNVFLRRYTDDRGRYVYLYIAYSQSSPKTTNPPEVFYKNSNISIIDKGKKNITIAYSDVTFKINWLLLDNNENQQMAYYWFKVGGIYTHSYWKQRTLAALNNIIGKKAGNALIRISTDVIYGKQDTATNLLNEFACQVIPQLIQNLP